MLGGERPAECHTCWEIEDLPGEQVSDRHLYSLSPVIMRDLLEIKNRPWDADFVPSYLEVSFDNICNFKCSYCKPAVSTKWHEEIKRYGAYELSSSPYHSLENSSGSENSSEDYIAAFWKWWPELHQRLQVFRITGGEPLLSRHTFRILEELHEHPSPHMDFHVNSNLGVPEGVIEKFLTSMRELLQQRKVKRSCLYTSIDNYGARAEYIRHGLDFKKFEKNLERVMLMAPQLSISFMCTFNALSVVGFQDFLHWFMDLRQRHPFGPDMVKLDISHLVQPAHQSVKILTPAYAEQVRRLVEFMKSHGHRFRLREVVKLERIYALMLTPQKRPEVERHRRDFYKFFSEHDRRRDTNFLKAFPEMRGFWELCQNT